MYSQSLSAIYNILLKYFLLSSIFFYKIISSKNYCDYLLNSDFILSDFILKMLHFDSKACFCILLVKL